MDNLIWAIFLVGAIVGAGWLRWRHIQKMWREGKPATPIEKRRRLDFGFQSNQNSDNDV